MMRCFLFQVRCSKRVAWTAIITLALMGSLQANVTLSDYFSDHMVLQRNKPIQVWGHATPGEKITVQLNGAKAGTETAADGNWSVSLPAEEKGGPYVLEVDGEDQQQINDVMLGDVWLASGQSNMDMRMYPVPPYTAGVVDYQQEIAQADHPEVRIFTVDQEAATAPKDDVHGVWEVSSPLTASNFSAVAYYFARKVNQETGVPIGVMVSSVGATGLACWVDEATARQFSWGPPALAKAQKMLADAGPDALAEYEAALPDFYEKARKARGTAGKLVSHPTIYKDFQMQVTGCYNAMIAPLRRVPLTGFLWYQGEADAKWWQNYHLRLEALIKLWRTDWNDPNAPFYIVQLAGDDPIAASKLDPASAAAAPLIDCWGKLRLEQRMAVTDTPGTGLAVACDQGEPTTPHYRNKKPVGERLALLALHRVYHLDFNDQGPILEKAEVQDDRVHLTFQTAKGPLVETPSGEVTGFEMAGQDQIYHPAQIQVDGINATLSSPDVKTPVSVRYGCTNLPTMSLFDSEGLPAEPFTWPPAG
jgi:sialate O-acetylesterase